MVVRESLPPYWLFEEIAKAVAILLEAGGKMTRDDLVLKTTRLIGYQRRGSRIETRVRDAIEILEDIEAINQDSDEKVSLNPDVQVDSKLLKRIY